MKSYLLQGPDVHSMDDLPLAMYLVPGVLIPYIQQPHFRSLLVDLHKSTIRIPAGGIVDDVNCGAGVVS